MTKYFCDRCGTEIPIGAYGPEGLVRSYPGIYATGMNEVQLYKRYCAACLPVVDAAVKAVMSESRTITT